MTFRPSHYVAAFLFVVSATSAVSQTLYLRADRLIDGLSDTVISDPVVLIEGDRISRVGDADSIRISAGANVCWTRMFICLAIMTTRVFGVSR